MAKRRGDNPLTILIMGIFTIALFGGVVSYYGSTKPILKLRPVLQKTYGSDEFETRFVPGRQGLRSYIVVFVPPHLSEVEQRLEIGKFSFDTYYELAEGVTQVQAVHVYVKDSQVQPVVVSEQLLGTEEVTTKFIPALEKSLRAVGVQRPRIYVEGIHLTGARVRVTGSAPKSGDPEDLARRALRVVEKRGSSISLIDLTLKVKGKQPIRLRGGRDAPPPPRQKPKPKPKPESRPPAPPASSSDTD